MSGGSVQRKLSYTRLPSVLPSSRLELGPIVKDRLLRAFGQAASIWFEIWSVKDSGLKAGGSWPTDPLGLTPMVWIAIINWLIRKVLGVWPLPLIRHWTTTCKEPRGRQVMSSISATLGPFLKWRYINLRNELAVLPRSLSKCTEWPQCMRHRKNVSHRSWMLQKILRKQKTFSKICLRLLKSIRLIIIAITMVLPSRRKPVVHVAWLMKILKPHNTMWAVTQQWHKISRSIWPSFFSLKLLIALRAHA